MASVRLEVFEEPHSFGGGTVATGLNDLEEARLASYEQGYSAGWEDAQAAQEEGKAQMSADLSHNMQALSFTYHDARLHVIRALEPLLTGLVDQILPNIAREVLGATVLQSLMPLAEQAAESPIQIMFNPAARTVLEPLLDRMPGPPLELVEEPTLGEGQVYLRLGANEVRVNLDAAITEISDALNDFLTLSKQELHNE